LANANILPTFLQLKGINLWVLLDLLNSGAHDFINCFSRLSLHVGGHVRISLQSERYVGVPESFRGGFYVDVFISKESGKTVS